MSRIMDELAQIETALAGEPETTRRGLDALLAGRRLRVLPDAERGFRVEGALRLRLEAGNPPGASSPPAGCQEGSGGLHRPARVTPLVVCFELPWGA
jgi:hypothetical protein